MSLHAISLSLFQTHHIHPTSYQLLSFANDMHINGSLNCFFFEFDKAGKIPRQIECCSYGQPILPKYVTQEIARTRTHDRALRKA